MKRSSLGIIMAMAAAMGVEGSLDKQYTHNSKPIRLALAPTDIPARTGKSGSKDSNSGGNRVSQKKRRIYARRAGAF